MSLIRDFGAGRRGASLLVALGLACASLRGWQRYALAAALGLLATLALPPFGLVPVLVPAFVGLVWLLDGSPRIASAFWVGWWFGLGHFTAGLYWIANALLIDAAQFWWLVPFAVLGLPAFLALFIGAGTALVRAFDNAGPFRILLLAAMWVITEYVRGHVLTGFPWNLVGYAWSDLPVMVQGAAYVGIYGLSLVTVTLAAAPAALVDTRRGRLDAGGVRLNLAALALLLVMIGGGAARLSQASDATVAGVRLRLVQADIAQSLKWRNDQLRSNFAKHIAMSRQPAPVPPNVIIWSEAASPYFLESDPDARRLAAEVAPEGDLLIAGAPRARFDTTGRLQRIWNSLVALDHAGEVRGTYDKAHLVPFGEYVPLRSILPINRIVPGTIDLSAGPGPRTLHLPGLPPVEPLICYEGIFPGAVIDDEDPPAWLLNISNDGWYGYSTGPYQHFAAEAMRAVENGVPMVRVANTGVSGIIDGWGRVRARLGLEVAGVIDSSLPVGIGGETVYRRVGDLPVLIALSALLLWAGFMRRSAAQ
jgi:apolipoprotein N-acyltransferase